MQMTAALPVPVIMISRRADTGAVIGGLRTGAIDYIRKPFDSEEVIARVGTILRFHMLDLKQRRSTAKQARASVLRKWCTQPSCVFQLYSRSLRTPRCTDDRALPSACSAARHERSCKFLLVDRKRIAQKSAYAAEPRGDAAATAPARRVHQPAPGPTAEGRPINLDTLCRSLR
jgi:hypothetical protein